MTAFNAAIAELGKVSTNISVDMTAFNAAMDELEKVNTDIKFIGSMAELENVTLSDEEKGFLETIRSNATTNMINTVNESTANIAESRIADMVNRGVLQGSIGRETIAKIYETAGKVIGEQSRNIESDIAGMGVGILEQKKQNQMGLWGKQLEADVASTGASLDKWKSIATGELAASGQKLQGDISSTGASLDKWKGVALGELSGTGQQQEWNQNLIQALTTMRGQDTSLAAARLGAETNLSMANKEMDVWKDVNEQSNWANIGSALIKAWW